MNIPRPLISMFSANAGKGVGGLVLACLATMAPATQATAQSTDWRFSPRIPLSPPPAAGVFHHLEGAGRKHIAVSAGRVGVVWEDNASGRPQIYIAILDKGAAGFTAPHQISAGAEAYEPAIAALDNGGFLIVYEQDLTVFARLWTPSGLSPPQRLSAPTAEAGHATVATTVATGGAQAAAVWREQSGRQYRLKIAALTIDNGRIHPQPAATVEPAGLAAPVLMPTLALYPNAVCVAWEDRRAGHTRLLTAVSPWPQINFGAPQHLNEFFSERNPYDKGSGVTRVALAAMGEDEAIAAWMDKRRGGAGYGIFAAFASEGGAIFGPNEKVHGAKGDKLPHYNPAVAANAQGDFIVAWDDMREGDLDIWLSRYNAEDEWSTDHTPTPATGPGQQSHPAVALDDTGALHLVWIERADSIAPSRLWYSRGRPSP